MADDSADGADGSGHSRSGASSIRDGWGDSNQVTPPVVSTRLSRSHGDIHEVMVDTVKEFDEEGSHRTGLRLVSRIQNGPYAYSVISYDSDRYIIDRIETGETTTVARSEEELQEIDEPRRFSVGISQEVRDIPATDRHMALVKAGSEYQRDGMDVAGIRIVGAEQQAGITYYKVSFESHPEVEAQYDRSD